MARPGADKSPSVTIGGVDFPIVVAPTEARMSRGMVYVADEKTAAQLVGAVFLAGAWDTGATARDGTGDTPITVETLKKKETEVKRRSPGGKRRKKGKRAKNNYLKPGRTLTNLGIDKDELRVRWTGANRETLNNQQREILDQYFGLEGEPVSMEVIALRHDLSSPSVARKVRDKALVALGYKIPGVETD